MDHASGNHAPQLDCSSENGKDSTKLTEVSARDGQNFAISQVSTDDETDIDQITVKMESLRYENRMLHNALNKLSDRLGSEVISDSEEDLSEFSDENKDPNVNTLHLQRDELFASQYFYITDVKKFSSFKQKKLYRLTLFLGLNVRTIIFFYYLQASRNRY